MDKEDPLAWALRCANVTLKLRAARDYKQYATLTHEEATTIIEMLQVLKNGPK